MASLFALGELLDDIPLRVPLDQGYILHMLVRQRLADQGEAALLADGR